MRPIASFLFYTFIIVLLLSGIAIAIVGSVYVLNIEIKELTGIDLVEKWRRHENL